jgi:predicted RNA-binding protein YlxR (DUF448 family)
MDIISRKEAKAIGLTRYFTGKPCKHGHVSERHVSHGGCYVCTNERTSNWKKNNKHKVNAICSKRKAAKLQRTPKWLIEDDFFLIEEAYSLAVLRTKMTGIEWQVDHVIPMQGKTVSGLHCPTNLQVIPSKVNISKNNKWDWITQQ